MAVGLAAKIATTVGPSAAKAASKAKSVAMSTESATRAERVVGRGLNLAAFYQLGKSRAEANHPYPTK